MRGTSEKTGGWRNLGGLMGQQPYEQCLSSNSIVFPLAYGLVPRSKMEALDMVSYIK